MAESRFLENVLPCANTLPCVFDVAHGKNVTFAVCQSSRHTANRVPNSLPCAAPSTHGKGGVCRVPDIWHTANVPFPVVVVPPPACPADGTTAPLQRLGRPLVAPTPAPPPPAAPPLVSEKMKKMLNGPEISVNRTQWAL